MVTEINILNIPIMTMSKFELKNKLNKFNTQKFCMKKFKVLLFECEYKLNRVFGNTKTKMVKTSTNE
jgi:hypothetical protein